MNRVILSGFITKDGNITKTNNIEIAKYSLAVTRTMKNKEGQYDTDFLNCVSFNPSDYVKDNLIKGTKLLVEGKIQNNSYTDDKGNKHVLTDIIVDRIEVLKKSENTQEKAKETPNNPFEEFGQQFEVGHQIEIDPDESLPF